MNESSKRRSKETRSVTENHSKRKYQSSILAKLSPKKIAQEPTPSTTQPAMSNKEIEDRKTIMARDKGYFGMSL